MILSVDPIAYVYPRQRTTLIKQLDGKMRMVPKVEWLKRPESSKPNYFDSSMVRNILILENHFHPSP